MVEMRRGAQAFYMQAELPPMDVMDLKGMIAQERVPGAEKATPQELLDILPNVVPCSTKNFVSVGEEYEGVYRADASWLKSLPTFQWDLLYKMGLPKVEKAKKSKKGK